MSEPLKSAIEPLTLSEPAPSFDSVADSTPAIESLAPPVVPIVRVAPSATLSETFAEAVLPASPLSM